MSGAYAYVADGYAGLHIIDISNPITPILVSTFDTIGAGAFGIYVSGVYAYVADWNTGLYIIDISNPAAPIRKRYHPPV
ncbi:MAG TPA: hypothetical protein DD477_10620, partial [Spirochaetaceae bacterium]|nr:hypothetical protein [Spirochaetaceae bacterium]